MILLLHQISRLTLEILPQNIILSHIKLSLAIQNREGVWHVKMTKATTLSVCLYFNEVGVLLKFIL